MIKEILVANRGEIAIPIMRACREIERVDAHITNGLFAEEAEKMLSRILGG